MLIKKSGDKKGKGNHANHFIQLLAQYSILYNLGCPYTTVFLSGPIFLSPDFFLKRVHFTINAISSKVASIILLQKVGSPFRFSVACGQSYTYFILCFFSLRHLFPAVRLPGLLREGWTQFPAAREVSGNCRHHL